jgi:hypothetical protein
LTEYLDSVKISHSITVLVVVLAISSISTVFLQLETKGMSLLDGGHSSSGPQNINDNTLNRNKTKSNDDRGEVDVNQTSVHFIQSEI